MSGLMAREILRGERPLYFWGQGYLGSLEPHLIAPLFAGLGEDVFLMRLPTIALFGLFLGLHIRLVRRWWGWPVALVSGLGLALPSWLMLVQTYRPMLFAPMAVFGTGALLLLQAERPRPALLGALLGLALWSYPMAIVYAAAIGLVLLLGSPEWAAVWRRVGTPGGAGAAVGLSALGLLALFSGGCGWSPVPEAATALLGLMLGGGALWVLSASPRRGVLLGQAARLGLGFMLGGAPMLAFWLFNGDLPSSALLPSCPTEVPGRLLFVLGTLLPVAIGLPPADQYRGYTAGEAARWLVATGIGLTALAVAVWRGRGALGRLATLAPLRRDDAPWAVLLLLFALPLALVSLGGNASEPLHARYLLLTWQAGTVMVGLLVAAPSRRWLLVGATALLLWVGQVQLGNLLYLADRWRDADPARVEASAARLEELLADKGVGGAFSDYWLTYPLNLLFEGRIVVAPYNAIDRRPAYTAHVAGQSVQAYVLPAGRIEEAPADRAVLLAGLTAPADPIHAASPPALARLARSQVLGRERVGDWDVWLVRPESTP